MFANGVWLINQWNHWIIKKNTSQKQERTGCFGEHKIRQTSLEDKREVENCETEEVSEK